MTSQNKTQELVAQEIATHSAKLTRFVSNQHKYQRLIDVMKDYGLHDSAEEGTNNTNPETSPIKCSSIHFSLTASGLDISLTGDKDTVYYLLRSMRKAGFATVDPTDRPQKGKSYWSTFFYEVAERSLNALTGKKENKLNRNTETGTDCAVWVTFSSTVCVRKQVGTRLEEVPVYETVCE